MLHLLLLILCLGIYRYSQESHQVCYCTTWNMLEPAGTVPLINLGSRSGRMFSFTPSWLTTGKSVCGAHWIDGWMGRNTGSDAMEKKSISRLRRKLNHDFCCIARRRKMKVDTFQKRIQTKVFWITAVGWRHCWDSHRGGPTLFSLSSLWDAVVISLNSSCKSVSNTLKKQKKILSKNKIATSLYGEFYKTKDFKIVF
jgi:hypothetical protein